METSQLNNNTEKSNIINLNDYEKNQCKKEAKEITKKIMNSKCKKELIQTLSGILSDYKEGIQH